MSELVSEQKWNRKWTYKKKREKRAKG